MTWHTCNLKDISNIGDGAHASIKRIDQGILYISSKNLGINGLNLTKVDYISENDYNKYFNSASKALIKPQTGDILLGIIGTLGTPYLVKDDDILGLSSSVSIIRPDTEKVIPAYCYYWMKSNTFQCAINQTKSGVAQSFLSLGMIGSLPITYPPVKTQMRIVDIIKSYDNLIENNRRRIALLEESARLLYQEWFVHLRFPGYKHTNITDGIPDGWFKKNLTDIVIVNESSLKNGFHGNIEYIDISSVSTNLINSTTWYDFNEAPGRARRVLKHGDIIWSCVRPNLKAYSFVWQPHDRLIASTGFAVISAKFISPFYLHQVLTTNEYISYLTNHAGGAAYPAVTAKVFENSEILVPPTDLLDDFDQFVEKIYRQISLLYQSNKKTYRSPRLTLTPSNERRNQRMSLEGQTTDRKSLRMISGKSGWQEIAKDCVRFA
jgi:type I restriction enzyme S subunit